MMDTGPTGCLRCYFIGTPEQFEHHECFDLKEKLTKKELYVNKQDLRDDVLFLRGLLQGVSFFSESTNMGAALESAEDQLQSISNRVLNLLDKQIDTIGDRLYGNPIPCHSPLTNADKNRSL